MTECLVHDMFGMINLLILKDRRILEDHLCTLHENLATFTKNDSYDYGQASSLDRLSKVPDGTPKKDMVIAQYLTTIPFFKRLSAKKIIKYGFLKKFQFE